MGDLPDADIKAPENVLFVCKLNPVTTDDDLRLIFSRFGKIISVRNLLCTIQPKHQYGVKNSLYACNRILRLFAQTSNYQKVAYPSRCNRTYTSLHYSVRLSETGRHKNHYSMPLSNLIIKRSKEHSDFFFFCENKCSHLVYTKNIFPFSKIYYKN